MGHARVIEDVCCLVTAMIFCGEGANGVCVYVPAHVRVRVCVCVCVQRNFKW